MEVCWEVLEVAVVEHLIALPICGAGAAPAEEEKEGEDEEEDEKESKFAMAMSTYYVNAYHARLSTSQLLEGQYYAFASKDDCKKKFGGKCDKECKDSSSSKCKDCEKACGGSSSSGNGNGNGRQRQRR